MDALSLDGIRAERRGGAASVRIGRGSSLLRRGALAAILLLAGGLLFFKLDAIGYANHYYTAGVASMLQSWRNFFFVAAEPGGAVSIDKPPVGLWLQAISAYFLGVNGFAMVLPEILCGLAAIVVLYHLVRRSFGTAAGLLAALALAITPIVVATDRNNTIDSSLILTLLLATWAFIKATESGRLRYLLLGAALVGVGFNIKMLQAYLPLPALYGLYFLGTRASFWRKARNLALATALLLAVSFAWIAAVDLTPASQRPYVGSSGTNSELNLAIGYNGLQRLIGMGGNVTSFLSRQTGNSNSANTGAGGGPGFGGGPGGFGGNGGPGFGTRGNAGAPSSMQGSDYVIATGRPVLYLGGFNGQDQVESAASLQQLVAGGQLRYIYLDARGGGGPGFGQGNGSQSGISSWVTSTCTVVQGFNTATRNQGAPDGTGGTTGNAQNGLGGFGGQMRVALYDCAAAG